MSTDGGDGGGMVVVMPDGGATVLDAGEPPVDVPDAGLMCDTETLGPIYERIELILSDEHADSCNACHLGGLDLAAFARPTACETMACLVDLGWADLDAPDESLLFDFIARAETADGGIVDGGAEQGITPASVEAEHEAFREWIQFSAACHDDLCGVIEAPCGAPPDAGTIDAGSLPSDAGVFDPADLACGPPAILDAGACSPEAERQLFEDIVWPWKGRCSHCHAEDAVISVGNPPHWMADTEDPHAPVRTMCSVAERGYLDVNHPAESLLLLKPLREQFGGIQHGGGTKFLSLSDMAYVGFRTWVDQWAACRALPMSAADAGVDAGAVDAGPDGGASPPLGDAGLEGGS
jgi:hypothetical protein